MKPSRLIPMIAALILLAGWILWAVSSDHFMLRMSAWLWVTAFGAISIPLLIWVVHAILQGWRNRFSSKLE